MGWDKFPTQPTVDIVNSECKEKYKYIVSIRWNETHKLPIRIGGLMRCCIATLEMMSGGNEGDIINCISCQSQMQVHDGAWEWVQ